MKNNALLKKLTITLVGLALLLLTIRAIYTSLNISKSFSTVTVTQKQDLQVSVSPTTDLTAETAQDSSPAIDPKLAEAKRMFPSVPEKELEIAVRQKVNLKKIQEERISEIQVQLNSLFLALQQYQEHFKKYPEGNNVKITKMLTGDNPEKMVFIILPKNAQSPTGEFIDPWGSPYDIKIETGVITVRSAGPDRSFNTEDDSVVPKNR